MTVQQQIETLLEEKLNPVFLQVVNESDGHNVPKGSESHFKVVIAADLFSAMSKVKRHQCIYQHLQPYLDKGVHALALHTFSPEEWAAKNSAPDSPACMGGSKA